MKKVLISTIVLVFLLMACIVMAQGQRGPGVDVVVTIPVLPHLVVMEREPYYNHQGYYYHYKNDRWYYSRSKGGPWKDLPRSHYANEVRYKNQHWKYDNGKNRYHRNDNYGQDNRNDNYGHDQWDDNRNDKRNDNYGRDNQDDKRNDKHGHDKRNDKHGHNNRRQ